MVWTCEKTQYQLTGKEDSELELRRVKKRIQKIEDDLKDESGKDIKDLDL